jgi:hypothetical protein
MRRNGMKQPKKRGRPTKEAVEGKRYALGLRVSADVKSRLDNGAKANGRTQSQEAEWRLQLSYDREDLLTEVLELKFGPSLAGLLILVGVAMKDTIRACSIFEGGGFKDLENWAELPYTFDQAIEAADSILKAARPAGKIITPDSPEEYMLNIHEIIGIMTARGYINRIDERASSLRGVSKLIGEQMEKAIASRKMILERRMKK